MSNKRSKRKKSQQFHCVYCEQQLWRLGSPKHFLFYRDKVEIRLNLDTSRKKAMFLATKGIYIDYNSWIEEFFCREHGKIWMLVCKKADGTLVAVPAKSHHWECTTGTIDPNTPNPSVSEFSYRMSRRTDTQLTNRFRSDA